MELLYVWIDEYKNISKQGFNFSPKYRFTYDHLKDELDFEETESLPDGFWGEGVSNLTLLLGKNGAGKSTLLEVLMKPLLLNRGFWVFKEASNHFIIFPKLIKVGHNLDKVSTNSRLEELNIDSSISFPYLLSFYYSPIFKGEVNDFNLNEINSPFLSSSPYNISTDSILMRRLSANNLQHRLFSSYNTSETLKKLRFVKDYKLFWLKISEPRPLPKIEILPRNINIDKENEILVRIKEGIDKNLNLRGDKNSIFIERCIFALLVELINRHSGVDIAEIEPMSHTQNFKSKDLLFEIAKKHEKQSLNFLKRIVRYIEDIVVEYSKFIKEKGDSISIPINNNSITHIIEKLIPEKLFLDDVQNIHFPFLINWSNLSSGENYLLSIFSRIKHEALNINLNFKGYLFLLDEGETTLHPHWQKQYIKWITQYIPMMFPEKKIQFLLTSNNPIIASDVPSSNIIFLDTDHDGKTLVRDKPLEAHNTFAANIHTLYRESFFMEDGLLGEFAKHKIEKLVEFFENPESKIFTEDDAQKLINLIGEPLIRERLQDMFDVKYGKSENINDLKTRIAQLEAENKRLRQNDKDQN